MTETGIDSPPFQLTRNGSLTKARLAGMRTAVIIVGSDDDAFFVEVMKLVRWIDAATAAYKFIILSSSQGGRTDAINVLEEHAGRDVVHGVLNQCGADLHWRAERRAAPSAVRDAMRRRNAYVLIGLPAPLGPTDAIDFGEIRARIANEFLSKGNSHRSEPSPERGFFKRRKVAWRERHWRRARRRS